MLAVGVVLNPTGALANTCNWTRNQDCIKAKVLSSLCALGNGATFKSGCELRNNVCKECDVLCL